MRLQEPEDHHVGDAKQRGAGEQRDPVPAVREAGIPADHEQQQDALRKAGIGLDLHLRQALDIGDRNPALAQRFDKIVGQQDQEYVGEHHERGAAFAGFYLGEQAQQSFCA